MPEIHCDIGEGNVCRRHARTVTIETNCDAFAVRKVQEVSSRLAHVLALCLASQGR
jgi:hypothetical protein